MTLRKVAASDVAGVTRVCNNLQILFTSTPQCCANETVCPFREKMPNRCVAAWLFECSGSNVVCVQITC